ncbi:MAG: RagB/SusD family nutrient uptake outer membrane protein [Cyclobacteriaceae bacterium]
MKKIIQIFQFTALSLALISCSDEFLEEKPANIATAPTLMVDASGFEAALSGIYAEVRREKSGQLIGNTDKPLFTSMMVGTDVIYINHFAGDFQDFNTYGNLINPANDHITALWEWLYGVVSASNAIISRAENSDINWQSDDPAAVRDRIVGEARFFRAWAYRHLTYLWGDVPLHLEESTTENIRRDWERSAVDDVYLVMEEDLLFAAEHLPQASDMSGKLVKGVAQHYLAELYLIKGQYKEARDVAQEVISDGPFSLVMSRFGQEEGQDGTPFTDLFIGDNPNSADNTEAMWVLQAGYGLIGGEGDLSLRRHFTNRYHDVKVNGSNVLGITEERGGRGLGRYAATSFMLNELYEDADDRGSEYAWKYFYIYQNNHALNPDKIPDDKTPGDTLFLPDHSGSETTLNSYWPGTRKWESAAPDLVTNARQYNDITYLRLAETYLLLAEAHFRLGDLNEAAQVLTELRARANASSVSSSDVTIDFILDERARELFAEEHRRYALIRNGKFLERIQAHNEIAGSNVTQRDLLLPIPQKFIDSNNQNQNFRQNPDY